MSTPMIAMTTNSSMSVNPSFRLDRIAEPPGKKTNERQYEIARLGEGSLREVAPAALRSHPRDGCKDGAGVAANDLR
jgi:hypothetical protein